MKKAIYKITNLISGKTYVGQSKDPVRRWKEHKWDAFNPNCKENSAIHDAFLKYGIENFEFTIIGWYENYNEMERYYIKTLNTLYPNGYNLTEGGDEPPHYYGEDHHNSKYSQELVNNIIDDLLSKKYTQKEIENKYKVNQQLVTSINCGETHRRKGIDYPIIKTSKYHCNEEDFEKIVYLLKNSSCTCAEIGAYFGFSTSTIKAINSGKNHHNDNITYPIRNFRGKSGSQPVEAILAKRSTETIDTSLEM